MELTKIFRGFRLSEYALWQKKGKPRNAGNQQKTF